MAAHHATTRFWTNYSRLPAPIRGIASKNFELLKRNPRHPSLQFKKVGRFWSVRVGQHHRALAIEDEGVFVWFWIGPHDAYETLIRS